MRVLTAIILPALATGSIRSKILPAPAVQYAGTVAEPAVSNPGILGIPAVSALIVQNP